MRGKKAVGTVAPVVREAADGGSLRDVLLVEGHDRQQLDIGNTEGLQVGDFLDDAREGARMRHLGGGVAGKPAHVEFIDHAVF
jgi:hypothetical protein